MDRNGKSRELFLDTASLEEICALIEDDWKDLRERSVRMKEEVDALNLKLKKSEEELQRMQARLEEQIETLDRKVKEIEDEK